MSAASTPRSPGSSLTTPGEISDTELAWLAGLLEGEGSFLMCRCRVGGKVYRYPKIVVGMTDRDVVERAGRLLGNNKTYPMPKQPRRKQAWRVAVTGWKAAELMRSMRPWLGERRREAVDAVLAEYDAQEPTQARRKRACSEAAALRERRADGTFKAAS